MNSETTTVRRFPHEVYFLRRLIAIYLPMIVIGMAANFYSYTLTFTANGLTVLALGWVFGWIGIAAWDGRKLS